MMTATIKTLHEAVASLNGTLTASYVVKVNGRDATLKLYGREGHGDVKVYLAADRIVGNASIKFLKDDSAKTEHKSKIVLDWLRSKSDQCQKDINHAQEQKDQYELDRLRTVHGFIKTAFMHEHTRKGREKGE